MPSVAFFRLTARSVLCVCMERNSLPTVPGTDNSHNRRRRPVTRHCRGTFYFLERSFRPYWRSRRRIVDRRERAEGDPTATPGFAEQQSTLTLAYKRTRTQWVRGSEEKEKSEDVSMGIILNFATGDVSGFDTFFDTLATRYYAKIAASNEVTIHFKGGIVWQSHPRHFRPRDRNGGRHDHGARETGHDQFGPLHPAVF
jgi:hypothetical protein